MAAHREGFWLRWLGILLVAAGLLIFAASPAHAQAPTTYWTIFGSTVTGTLPEQRHGYAATYDAAHGQEVVFGGISESSGTILGGTSGTFTFDGTTWIQYNTASAPSPRLGAQMAYDAAQGVVVLFGGFDGTNELNDTWTWDGANWTLLNPGNSPPARNDGAMAYDAAHGQVVLFGGAQGATLLSDTWTWNGSNWTAHNPNTVPPARVDPVFAFDRVNDAPLMCDGYVASEFSNDGVINNAYGPPGAGLQDLWSWDGSNWHLLSSSGPAMAYVMGDFDASTNQLVVLGEGGTGQNNTPQLDFWNGASWSSLAANNVPGMDFTDGQLWVASSRLVYIAQANQLVEFAGQLNDGSELGNGWILQLPDLNFGTANVCPSGTTSPAPCSQSATLYYTLGSANWIIYGDSASTGDFSVGSVNCSQPTYYNTPCSIPVTFTPSGPGLRRGGIVVTNDAEIYFAGYFHGIGVAPRGAVYGGVPSPLGWQFAKPVALAVNQYGGVNVLDQGQNSIEDCFQCTVGSGFNNPSALALDGVGSIYIADTGSNQILKEPANGGNCAYCFNDQVSLWSGLNSPIAVAVDQGNNLYVAQAGDNTVIERPWNSFGYDTPITVASPSTVPSNLSTNFTPSSLAVDSKGNVFIGDTGNGVVEEISNTLWGFGSGTVVENNLSSPAGLAFDPADNLFIADLGLRQIIRVPWTGTSYGPPAVITDTTNNGALFSPVSVSVDQGGNVYYLDSAAKAVSILYANNAQFGLPNTHVNTSSAFVPFTFFNIGNAPLSFPQPPTGSNPSTTANFALGGTTCPLTGTLAQGQSCTQSVNFSPLVGGNLTGSLVFTDNAQNSVSPNYATQTVSLTGASTGITTQFSVSAPAAVNIGMVFNITVTALDIVNSIQPEYRGTIQFTSTDGAAVLPSSYIFTAADAGVHTFQVTANSLGLQTVTATSTADSTITGTSGTISVNVAPSITSGNSATFTIHSFGNLTVTTLAFPIPAFSEVGNLPTGVGFTDNGNGTATLSGTPAAGTANVYPFTIQASNGWGVPAIQNFTLTVINPSTFVVTLMTDDATGVAANCPSGGGGASCTLRDALAAAAGVAASDIYFSPSPIVPTGYTVTLTGGTLTLPSNTVIHGLTSGSGAALTNLVTVSGANAVPVFTLSSVLNGGTGSGIHNLNITNGYNATGYGGGVVNAGNSVTIDQCLVSQNSALSGGGGIYNTGELTLTNSTLSGNSVFGTSDVILAPGGGGLYTIGFTTVINSTIYNNSAPEGGGIYFVQLFGEGTLALSDSTVYGNSSTGEGGGLNFTVAPFAFELVPGLPAVPTLANDLIAGNSAGQYADVYAPATQDPYDKIVYLPGYQDNGGNRLSISSGGTSTVSANLAPIGNYGGPTPTMIPLPGSTAICAGIVANASLADQRGFPGTNTTYTGYSAGSPCVDTGAVQTNYQSLQFTNVPISGHYSGPINQDITPAPSVSLTENGLNFGGVSITLGFSGTGTASGLGPVATVAGSGAEFDSLSVGSVGTDTLSATLQITPSVAITTNPNAGLNIGLPAPTITLTGNTPSPSVVGQQVTFTFTVVPGLPATGTPTGNVTVSDGLGDSCTASVATGQCKITFSVKGLKTFNASYAGDSNFAGSSTASDTPHTVNAANTQTTITGHSPNPSITGQQVAVSFTVVPVSPGSGAPTGTVTVRDGKGDSCAAAVAIGQCTITFATPGVKSLTASYPGDGNFIGSTSPPVSQSSRDFAVSASPSRQSVGAGEAPSFSLTLTPLAGFTGSVALTCSGVPAGSSCTFSSNTVTLTGTRAKTSIAKILPNRHIPKGSYTITFTGKYGSGNPSTGGLTHNASVILTVR